MNKQTGIRFEKQQNIVLENIKYDNCVFFDCHFDQVIWRNCHFYQTTFNGNSTFSNCRFIDWRFTGQYTHLGSALYRKCDFRNIVFKDTVFGGSKFINCKFSGKASNIVFYGENAPKGWETYFDNVDISKLTLDTVDYRTNFDFSKTIR